MKCNYLKYKPDADKNHQTSLTTTIQDTLKPKYVSSLKNNTHTAPNSINQNINRTGEIPPLQQILQSFTSKYSRSRSKLQTRKASKKKNQQNK